MFEIQVLIVIAIFLLLFWILPAIVLTVKVLRVKKLDASFKRQIIMPMWLVPCFGNLICYMVFARTGKLNRLSTREHRRIWADKS